VPENAPIVTVRPVPVSGTGLTRFSIQRDTGCRGNAHGTGGPGHVKDE